VGTKRRAVVNAEADHLARIDVLVTKGRYRTLSDFVREAVDEKLARVERDLLEDEVARYCAAGHAAEDDDIIAAQAFPSERSAHKRAKRATR
jgi:Arc/MetJ-type ribon-helix-helix transcriptional regulator